MLSKSGKIRGSVSMFGTGKDHENSEEADIRCEAFGSISVKFGNKERNISNQFPYEAFFQVLQHH